MVLYESVDVILFQNIIIGILLNKYIMGKQQFLAYILILMVLFLTPKYMELIVPDQGSDSEKIHKNNIIKEQKTSLDQEKIETQEAIATFPRQISTNEEIVFTVETPLYIVEITNSGGGSFKSFLLKKYHSSYLDDGSYLNEEWVSLLFPDSSSCAPCLVFRDQNTNSALYFDMPFKTNVANGQFFKLKEGESSVFNFNYFDNSNNKITSSLKVFADFYHFDYSYNIVSSKDPDASKEIAWTKALRPTEENENYDVVESGAVIWQVDDKEEIGYVTSKCFSPRLKKNIGYAFIPIKYAKNDTEFEIRSPYANLKAKVVGLPFFDPKKRIPIK